jgi:nitroimidazol reductase NimA-like FMN-containing flavoprotein (pyridoxamine 5'-phosphate oxidase superfamily)
MSELETRAAVVIAGNKYLTLATVDSAGLPWATPVFFTPDGHRDVYWVSSPAARHSLNIAASPSVSIVVFDSSVPVGQAQAVYLTARAELVPDAELADRAHFYSTRLPGLREFTPDELRTELRLYRARVTEAWILIRGGDPDYGTGIDSRRPIWTDSVG